MSYSRNQRRHTSRSDWKRHAQSDWRKKLKIKKRASQMNLNYVMDIQKNVTY